MSTDAEPEATIKQSDQIIVEQHEMAGESKPELPKVMDIKQGAEGVKAIKVFASNLMDLKVDVKALKLESGLEKELKALEKRKKNILRDIDSFISFVHIQVQYVKTKIALNEFSPSPVKFSDMPFGPNKESVKTMLTTYSTKCTDLGKDYETFASKMGDWALLIGGVISMAIGALLMLGAIFASGEDPGARIGVFAIGALTFTGGYFMHSAGKSQDAAAKEFLKKIVAQQPDEFDLGLDSVLSDFEKSSSEQGTEINRTLDEILETSKEVSDKIEAYLLSKYV